MSSVKCYVVQSVEPSSADESARAQVGKIRRNRRAAGMLNPLRDTNEGTDRGGKATPVITACPKDAGGKTSYELSRKSKSGDKHTQVDYIHIRTVYCTQSTQKSTV